MIFAFLSSKTLEAIVFFTIFACDLKSFKISMSLSTQKTQTSNEDFKAILKKFSLKATPQRLAVHSAMTELGHASADQVSGWIEQNVGGHTTVASVYNILTQLALLGVYSHRLSANNKMFFDVNTHKHMHLYDCVNHEYKDVMDDELIAFVENRLKSKKFRGFKVDCVDIQIVGRPSTRKSTTRKNI